MEYDLYHDESKEAGYWHGILLVPRATRADLLGRLNDIRTTTCYNGVLGIKNLDRTTGRRFRCAEAWLSLGVQALAQRFKGNPLFYRRGTKSPNPTFVELPSPVGARFILFKVRDGHASMDGYPDHGARIETTFRMGLKGGLHLFADEGKELEVSSFHFDGHKHHGRRIDSRRIVERVGQLREGVRISRHLQVDDAPSDHTKSGSQPHDDCQLLQLTDLLVGGFRTVLGVARHSAQAKAAEPLRQLADRWHDGAARMKQSRWNKGFCVSECFLDQDGWGFSNLRPEMVDRQMKLEGM